MGAGARLYEPAARLCAFAAVVLVVVNVVLGAPTPALLALTVAAVGCALLGHRPLWAAFAAVAAAGLGALALALDEAGPRPWLGGAALAAGVIYAVPSLLRWWRRRASAHKVPPAKRWPEYAGLVCSSALALGGALIGAAFIGGAILAYRTQPIPLFWMYLGLVVLALGILVLLWWWSWTFVRDVLAKKPKLWLALPGAAALVFGLWQLQDREITNARTPPELAQLREAALGRFDLLLALDPADPASRRLIEAAQRDLRPTPEDPLGDRIEALLAPRVPDSPYDVAFGLAVAEPAGGDRPLWRLVEPPTQDNRELAESLAAIPLRSGAPAPGSYGRLLHDATIQQRVRWREGSQRGVAFMLERLPAEADLDGGGAGVPTPDEDDPSRVCDAFDGASSERSDRPLPPSQRVSWGEALRRLCFERRVFGDWVRAGRPRESRVLPPIGIFALTREADPARVGDWSTWTRATGGRVHIIPAADRLGSDPAVELLQHARDVFTGQPVQNLAEVVETFRPHLFFDESEKFAPVDVDWMLYPDARRPREGATTAIECTLDGDVTTSCEQVSPQPGADTHRVCDREPFSRDNCEPITARASLAGSLDELIDFAGGARLGADVVKGDLDPPRMYVHVREEEGRIFLGYWWYFRYNVSPWRAEVNCLPGLGFGGLSCHDHEGDWEGVTVVLEPLRDPRARDPYVLGNLQPDAVVYDAHGRSIRWEWPQVDLAADDGHYATHPVVYVAVGSHASYPTGCRRPECDQRLNGKPELGEGGFDGGKPWRFNAKDECNKDELSADTRGPCLVALPSTDGGTRGVLWNAFPGAWGRARCTVVGKVCSQVDGPRSPSEQGRFKFPSRSRPAPRALKRMRDRYGRPHADSPRWPPEPWPAAPGEPLPTTARLND